MLAQYDAFYDEYLAHISKGNNLSPAMKNLSPVLNEVAMMPS